MSQFQQPQPQQPYPQWQLQWVPVQPQPQHPLYATGDYLWLAFSIVTIVAAFIWNTLQVFGH